MGATVIELSASDVKVNNVIWYTVQRKCQQYKIKYCLQEEILRYIRYKNQNLK